MTATEKQLIYLLNCALLQKEPVFSEDVIDWDSLYELAQAHKIEGMILDTVCALPPALRPPEQLLDAWQQRSMVVLMGQIGAVEQQHELLRILENNGIKAVVVKGIAIKMIYPQPDFRTMSDADLLVSPDSFEKACELLESVGYERAETEPGVAVYHGPDGLRVELHQKLFEHAEHGFLSRLDEDRLFSVNNAVWESVYMGEAWVFPCTLHLLLLLCHMAKHMVTTGYGLRQELDYILYIKRYDAAIDWSFFWKETKALGLTEFASVSIRIGQKFFELEKGQWDQGIVQTDDLTADSLLEDILDAGVFGKRTQERIRSAAVVYRAFDSDDQENGRIRRALFPAASTLKAPYLYARKHPVLLPVAWIHRGSNFLIHCITGKHTGKEIRGGIQVANERLQLLGQLGLDDNKKTGGDRNG